MTSRRRARTMVFPPKPEVMAVLVGDWRPGHLHLELLRSLRLGLQRLWRPDADPRIHVGNRDRAGQAVTAHPEGIAIKS